MEIYSAISESVSFFERSKLRDIATEVGHLIRTERKSQNISQEGLAALAKIDRSYMGRIERGEVNITLKALWDISDALSIPAKQLIPD